MTEVNVSSCHLPCRLNCCIDGCLGDEALSVSGLISRSAQTMQVDVYVRLVICCHERNILHILNNPLPERICTMGKLLYMFIWLYIWRL